MNSTQPNRKRKREMSENNATDARKRQAISREPTESGRNSRDGHQPGSSRAHHRIPTPNPDFSALAFHAKTAKYDTNGGVRRWSLSDEICNRSFAMPLFVNAERSISRSEFPPIPSIPSRQVQVPNSTIPNFDGQQPPGTNSRQSTMVQPSPSVVSGCITRDRAAAAAAAAAQSSLPLTHLSRYTQDRIPPSRCMFCYPPRPIPRTHLSFPASAGRAEFLPQVVPRTTYASHPSIQSNQNPQLHPRHAQPSQIADMQTNMPLPSVVRTSLWEIPNLHNFSQFASDPNYRDANHNQIPSHSRIPFREIEQFNMTMRGTRSATQRNPSTGIREAFSRFTEGLSHLTESWMERYPGADMENAFVLMPNQTPAELNILPSIAFQNYEALLGLAQRLSEAKPKGLSKSELDQLVIFHYNSDANKSSITNCVVCMNDFENRKRIRVLGCKHQFHSKCVDKWLKSNRTCPLCRADALEAKKTPKKKISSSTDN